VTAGPAGGATVVVCCVVVAGLGCSTRSDRTEQADMAASSTIKIDARMADASFKIQTTPQRCTLARRCWCHAVFFMGSPLRPATATPGPTMPSSCGYCAPYGVPHAGAGPVTPSPHLHAKIGAAPFAEERVSADGPNRRAGQGGRVETYRRTEGASGPVDNLAAAAGASAHCAAPRRSPTSCSVSPMTCLATP
jgi:hypothetical protein